MLQRWVRCARRITSCHVTAQRRLLVTQPSPDLDQLSNITRNIGIIAHIDAGKTTTTERMLYYSGYTRRIGDVDEGSTVTDFLPAERARGITIQSAAITLQWPPHDRQQELVPSRESFDNISRSSVQHNINLIDTPGHADFTFEVLRSLRVLDGAVCILDGVAGVEAQTEKVWTQARYYSIPRIIFVNKLDREGAAFSRTVKEIGTKLHGWPAVCQIPWWSDGKGAFVGVGDVVNLRGLRWEGSMDGRNIQAFDLEQMRDIDHALADELTKARVALVELLSEHDDLMVEQFLEHDENHLAVPGLSIIQSLRRVVLSQPQSVIPVFAGASFRNIGVQPLLDNVVDLLPSPLERPDPEISIEGHVGFLNQLLTSASTTTTSSRKRSRRKSDVFDIAEARNLVACALAFKVVNDPKRGVLVYVRIYSGTLDRNSVLFNTSLRTAERAQRLLQMYASNAVEVDKLSSGQIGVISGLKHARTGDTLLVYKGLQMKAQPPAGLQTLQLRPINIPPPVFFTSIEPNSLGEQKHVQECLAILLREDPSLQLSTDEESGQTHLAGMGDLHLEIARDRLLHDFKAKARVGKIEIGYRETVNSATAPAIYLLDKVIAGRQAKYRTTVSVSPNEPDMVTRVPLHPVEHEDGTFETTSTLPDSSSLHITHLGLSRHDSGEHKMVLPPHLSLATVLSAIHAGASAATARGPFNGFPVSNVNINITLDAKADLHPESTTTAISTGTRIAVAASLRAACDASPATLLEPVMLVTIFVTEASLGAVVQDISSSRGGQVISLESNHEATSSNIEHTRIDPARIYAPPDPFFSGLGSSNAALSNLQRQIVARVPLKEMVGYLNQLRALTGGRGTFVMTVDGFERMGSQRQKEVLDAMQEFE